MEHDLAKRLHEAVRALNARADRARRTGLPFAVEAKSLGPAGSRVVHLTFLRSMPVGDLPSCVLEQQCSAEIALLSIVEEFNRLANEARQQNLPVELRFQPLGDKRSSLAVDLVFPEVRDIRRPLSDTVHGGATNIIPPAFPWIGASLGVSSPEGE